MRAFWAKALKKPIAAIVLSLLVGFAVGAIVLQASGFPAGKAYRILFAGMFAKPKYVAQVIVNAVPLTMTGLSVAFAMKTGLFNIGAEGQFVIGALTGALIGHYVSLPPVLHPLVILIFAFAFGGAFAALAGHLKNRFGIHEVISTIMLNWIAFYLNNFIVSLPGVKVEGSLHSPGILDTAKILFLKDWKRGPEGLAFIRANSFWGGILRTDIGYGILLAVLAAIAVHLLLKYSKTGFALRAVGLNKDAAELAGISIKKNVLLTMFISGGLAAAGGAMLVMTSTGFVSILSAQEGYGWDGISVSLIANSNPIGAIFAGWLFSGLRYGGSQIQSVLSAPTEVINIMIGAIVLAIAFAPAVKRLGTALERGK